jgi:hypothetical protein
MTRKYVGKAMAPSAGLDLKTLQGRTVTEAELELELIERRETNKPKLGIKTVT